MENGHPPVSMATVRGFVGRGAPALIDQLVAHLGLKPDDAPDLLERFIKGYEGATDLTQPFPGVPAALGALERAGFALSICTNKPDAPTLAVLSAMGWSGRFDPVIGGDTLTVRKPDPGPLLAATGGTDQSDCLFVGDSEVDAETAERAGVRFALFTEGYRKSPVSSMIHDFAFSDFDALPEALSAGIRTR
jgi:phosphoglycolate phosphatase